MPTLFSLAVSIGMLLVAAGIGRGLRLLVSRVCSRDTSAGERIVVDATLGLGVVSLVIFAACAMQLLRVGPGIAIAGATTAASLPGLPGIVRDARAVLGRLAHPGSIYSFGVTGLLIGLGAAVLIAALAPPSMSDWDSLAYHLAVPKLFIEHGGFYYINFTTHSNFPFLIEMLYIPGLALGDPVAAKLMHFWIGALLVGAVTMLTRRHFRPEGAPTAALAVGGMPIVLWEATTAYVDLATALYTVAGLHLLLSYFDTRESSELWGCGLAAGFAASTKMIGLALIPMLAVWLVTVRKTGRWRSAGVFVGVAAAVCLPWYLKSFMYTGNPVYPFFYSVFGGRDWSVELARNYASLQAKFGLGHGIGAFLMLPYNLAFHSEAFYDTPGLYVGPLMIVALPIIAFAGYRPGNLAALALFCLAQTVLWFALSQQSRYLIPALAVLAIVAAGLGHTDERFRWTRPALAVVFSATALFGLVVQLWPEVRAAAPVALGIESRRTYLERRLDVYPAQEFINEQLPRAAKVALFGDTRGFYLDRNYAWADWGHNMMFSRSFASGMQLARYLRKNGFGYAVVNFGIAFPRPEEAKGTAKAVYEAIDSGNFERIYPSGDGGSVAVYEIR